MSVTGIDWNDVDELPEGYIPTSGIPQTLDYNNSCPWGEKGWDEYLTLVNLDFNFGTPDEDDIEVRFSPSTPEQWHVEMNTGDKYVSIDLRTPDDYGAAVPASTWSGNVEVYYKGVRIVTFNNMVLKTEADNY